MAQSPANLQEPSMDELLASIREIIEESSAAAEAGEPSSVDSLESDVLEMANNKGQDQAMQEDALGAVALPIHDAMKALAARIGLKKQANSEKQASPKEEVAPSPFTLQSHANVPDPSVSAPLSLAQAAVATPSPMPLSLSLQATTAPKLQLSRKQVAPLAKPQKAAPPANLSQTPNKDPLPVGHIPLYPQFRTSAPSQQVATALVEPHVPNPTTPEASSPQAGQKPESKRELNALEQGFLAEFEQSAELLLRPYIASWLEEHFQNLFEKILREEIQRLMQKNLRR